MSDETEYTLRWRGRESGPFPLAEINRRLDDHEIGLGHEIFCHEQWITLEQFFAAPPKPVASPVPRVAAHPAGTHLRIKDKPSPPVESPVVSAVIVPSPPVESKVSPLRPRHRLVFALLGVFLGFVGTHNFYARQWLTGLLQLLLAIATYLMGFGIIATWIWAMIEAIVVRKDGDGIEMI